MKVLQSLCLQMSVLILFSPLFQSSLFCQTSIDYNWYLNANAGIAQSYGDVQDESNPFGDFQDETGSVFGLRFGRYVSPVFAVHAHLLSSSLIGQKTSNDINFKSNLIESQLGFSVNLINLFSKEKRNRTVNIYALSGIGMIFFRSELNQISTGEVKSSYGYKTDGGGEEDKMVNTYVVPIGGGLDFRLTDRWYMNLESVFRFVASDKLDAVEGGSNNDALFYTSLGLTYHFGRKKKVSTKKANKVINEIPDEVSDSFIKVEYVLPERIVSGRKFDMKCIITKGDISGKAELTQVLPIGFIVKDTIIGGAHAESKNYTLHLFWDDLPLDSVFELNYTLFPGKVYGTFPFTSILYLDKTGKEYRFNSSVVVDKGGLEEKPVQQKLIVTEAGPINRADSVSTEKPISNVEFRVQVRASRRAIVPIQKLAERYHITGEIKEDFVGKWFRYSIGSFLTYDGARDFRNRLILDNGVRDAFIVAFYKGERLNGLSELKEVAPSAYPVINAAIDGQGAIFRVQVLAVKFTIVDTESLKSAYGLQGEVNEEVFHNWRKYTIGRFTSLNKAEELRSILVEKGISDAFIVIYQNGKRFTINNRVN